MAASRPNETYARRDSRRQRAGHAIDRRGDGHRAVGQGLQQAVDDTVATVGAELDHVAVVPDITVPNWSLATAVNWTVSPCSRRPPGRVSFIQ